MSKPYDIILWGATGFTGQLVAEYLAQHAPATIRWAIAGRNQQKLESVRTQLATFNPNLKDMPILLGDSYDSGSMSKLAAQTRVICSTVGPYALYGTPLVEACVQEGIAYCDLTGETTWIRQIIDQFELQAQQTGAKIVHCCGYDSIPSDLGTLMVQEYAGKQYGRFCHTIKHYIVAAKGGYSGGTVSSMLNLVTVGKDDKNFRRTLANPYSLVPGHKHDWAEADLMSAAYDNDINRWVGPFMMASINTRIVRRSHALQEFRYGSDFTFHEMTRFPDGVKGRLTASSFANGFKLFALLSAISPIRRLLESTVLPKPGEGPDKETRENGYFVTHMLGKIRAQEGHPEQWLKGKVAGQSDPGYGETAKMMGESALCLAMDDLPAPGGILTPATAMGMTLIDRLRRAGMTFEVGEW